MNKKLLAIGGAALLGVGAFGGYALSPEKIVIETKIEEKLVEVPGPVQEKIVNNTIEKIVYQDNGKLADVEEYIFDNEGNLSRVVDDLDDDELHLISERIVMENDFIALAENAARSRAFSELHKDNSTGVKLDREDMSFRKEAVDEDFTAIEWIDYEDGDGDVLVKVNFKQDDDKFEAILRVIIEDSMVEDVELETVTKL